MNAHLWQPGLSANPGGKSANGLTWQWWRTAIKSIWDDYSTQEIMEIAKKAANGDAVPVSIPQAMVIAVMAKVIREGCGKSLEMLLDRILGKVPQVMQVETNVNLRVFQMEELNDDELIEVMAPIESKRAQLIEATPVESNAVTNDPA